MRRGAILLAALLVAAVLRPASAADASKERDAALRALLTKVLAEPDAPARRTLASGATALAGDLPLADVVAAVRRGPVLTEAVPKPRKVAGRTEELTAVGTTVVGYTFEHAGAAYRYAVDVPRGYDPAKPAGLLLDPGHGTGKGKPDKEKAGFLDFWRRQADASGHADWLVARTEIIEQIGGDGARGEQPEDDVALVFDAFFRDLVSRFAVDPDRIYVTGLSQTGFWAWYLGAFRTDRFAGIAPMSAVTWHVDAFTGNFAGLPVHVLHGEGDPICPPSQPRRLCAVLARMGLDVRYREIAGAAHDGAVWQNLPDGLKWLGEKPRERYPRRLSRSVRNTSAAWRSWIRIDAVEKDEPAVAAHKAGGLPMGGVDAEIDGQTIRVRSDGVPALTVCLSAEMLDLAKPVTIVWNGATVHEAVVKPDAATLYELAGERCDWTATFVAKVSLRK